MKLHGVLNNIEISRTVVATEEFLQRSGAEEKMRLAARLALEEVLLVYQKETGETNAFDLVLRKSFDGIRCVLTVRGDSVDPCGKDIYILHKLLKTTDFPAPVWQYDNGRNRVILSVPLYNTTLKNLKFSWSYVQRYRKLFFIAVGCQWVNVVLNIAAPILSAKIIVALTDSAFEQIVLTALALFVVNVISDLSLYFCNTRYNMVYNGLLSDMENDLANSTLRITNSCLENKGGGLFIQRLTVDTATLATGFNTMADLISQMFRYIGVLIAMLTISPAVFFVVLILLASQIFIELLRTKRMTKDDRIYRQASENLSGFISEMIHGASDVKLLNSEKAFQSEVVKRTEAANNNHMIMLLRAWKYKLTRWGIAETGKLGFICLLAWLIINSGIAPAKALVLYNYYTDLGASAVLLLGQLLEFLKNFDLSTERICAILNNPEFPKESFGKNHLDCVRGEISFSHVSFRYDSPDPRYPSREILKDMSFVIPAGTTAALVGKSGCGKSTVFRLLCRLADVTKGSVCIDGTDINTLDRESIRGNITVVSQNPYLFHLSIRDNLRLVKPDLTDEEMQEVCGIAQIADDIKRMPQGYDSLIGEGGVNLSGGQRQRLAIARSLLRDTPIMLLDEATSALDNVTQMEIMKGLDEVRKGRTLIMIAHRLSTVINADLILFIEDGKILDQGTHQELLERCASYRELYETDEQAGGKQD